MNDQTELPKLEIANRVLLSFAPDSYIEKDWKGYWYVTWSEHEKKIARRWLCRGQDFYPVWSHRWPHGGTACTALSQLIRWLRGVPVLPLSSWRYWASERIALFPLSAVDLLESGGYPKIAKCVLCGEEIHSGFDWWHLKKVSGPCCSMRSGCRQVNSVASASCQ